MGATTSILDAIFAVFTAIGNWIVTAVDALVPMFWAEGALTFFGVLAIVGLGFSVVFLKSYGRYLGDKVNGSSLIAGKS